ncbi:MAG: hypothetical protein AB7F79_09480 [Steroidobacteraceae bacterium]
MGSLRHLHIVAKLVGLLTGMLACVSAWSENEQLNDLAGRMEYAFYAEDSRSLQLAIQSLTQLELDTESDMLQQQQQLDYGRWKLAQLLGKHDPALATQMAEECADSKIANTVDGTSLAIRHALHAACLSILAQLRPLRSVLYKRQRNAEIDQALQIDSRSPQVQLVSAWLHADDKEPQDMAPLSTVVAAYDAAALVQITHNVLWGHAESCYLLGQLAIANGESLAARNALERALILMPDYQAASTLLRSLTVN